MDGLDPFESGSARFDPDEIGEQAVTIQPGPDGFQAFGAFVGELAGVVPGVDVSRNEPDLSRGA